MPAVMAYVPSRFLKAIEYFPVGTISDWAAAVLAVIAIV
jgi:hypothetical protein